MAKSNDILKFKELGFSENDAAVYLALCELKIATANPLITKTGLHQSLVYTSLEHLVARKLVSKSENKGKRSFSIVSPDALVEEFSEKQNIAKDLAAEIRGKIIADGQEITIHHGNEEYLSLLTSLLKQMPKGDLKYVMGTGGESFMRETMRPMWKKYHKVAKEGGVSIKMLGYENQKNSFQKEAEAEGIYDMRWLSNDLENPAGIHIYPKLGVVLNVIYSNTHQPVTAIKIKDKNLVEGYLNLFTNLWQQAKK